MEYDIVKIGIDRFKSKRREVIHFVDDDNANKLLCDIENNPHVFVLACLMDRQIKSEKAWMIPQKIFDIVGTHDFFKLKNIKQEEIAKIFLENKIHRFNNDMAKIFYEGIKTIEKKHYCDASNIWKDKPSSALVVYRFLDFNGCGIKIATMASNILARQFKINFSDYYSIDISPDIHIKRVLSRMGLVSDNPSSEMVIYKARELYPKFPGVIDFSCWEIGRKYCHASKPDCRNCIVNFECKNKTINIEDELT
jgi:endonuclease III